MQLSELKEKLKKISQDLNKYGICLPTIRDPSTGLGSVSLTMLFISFNFCLLAMVGKWSGFLGGIDPSQALNLFMVCAGLYFGRKLTAKDGKVESLEEKEK